MWSSALSQATDVKVESGTITALEIGDIVPPFLWDTEWSTVTGKERTIKNMKLSEHKGKLIILDFWATWCSSCIAAMPQLHKVAHQFPEEVAIISVTMESLDIVSPFLKNHEKIKDLELTSVIDAQLLKKYFQYRMIPHLVWIGTDGKILHFSSPKEVTLENINAALKGNFESEGAKIDIDTLRPLFSIPELPAERTLFYCVFIKGHQPGLSKGNRSRRKGRQVYGLAMYNMTIQEMYKRLYSLSGQKVKDITFAGEPDPTPYTFEMIFPLEMADKLGEKMIQHLNEFSGFRAVVTSEGVELQRNGP